MPQSESETQADAGSVSSASNASTSVRPQPWLREVVVGELGVVLIAPWLYMGAWLSMPRAFTPGHNG